jgi:HNH endonuclease
MSIYTDLTPHRADVLRAEMLLRYKVENGCWQWTGPRTQTGYGQLNQGGDSFYPHRLAWILLRGPITDDLTVDHLCRNRSCINPDHLEPTTQRENILRGTGASARHAQKTTCPNGHVYDAVVEGPTYGPRRRCSRCSTKVATARFKRRYGTRLNEPRVIQRRAAWTASGYPTRVLAERAGVKWQTAWFWLRGEITSANIESAYAELVGPRL